MALSLQQIALALNGEVDGNKVRAPGPGHSAIDRSLTVWIAHGGDDITVHSFANDNPIACKKYVRERCGIKRPEIDLAKLMNEALACLPAPNNRKQIATFTYTDANGAPLYQKRKYDDPQHKYDCWRSDGNGGWIQGLNGGRRVPYNWPQLIRYPNTVVFLTEGEKDADNVASLGLCATTIIGAGSWTNETVQALKDRDVVILQDNDDAGIKRAQEAAQHLHGVAARVRVCLLPDLSPKEDVTDWIEAGGTVAQLEGIIKDVPDWVPTGDALPAPPTPKALPPPRLFPLVKATDLAADDIEDEFLVDELLPRIGVGVIWGPPKCGKSFWTMDVAMHVALGWQYRGRFVEQGTVIYLALEGQRGMRKRVLAFFKHHFGDRPVPAIPFHLVLVPVKISNHARKLIDEIRLDLFDEAPKLIIIDTLARALVGSKSEAKDMGAFIDAADTIRSAFNCCVLIVHHCGWNADHLRGSSSLPAALDVELECCRADHQGAPVIVRKENAKDMDDSDEIISTLQRVDTGRVNRSGNPITSMVVVPADGATAAPVTKKMSDKQKLAIEALAEATLNYGVDLPPRDGMPRGLKAVTASQWFDELVRRRVIDPDGPNPRARLSELRTSLAARRLIGIDGDIVWLAR